MIGIVMGSTSDWETMKAAAKMLKEFGVKYEAKAMSAHRSPHAVVKWVESAPKRGVQCIIAAAGGAAHLAGVVAAHTTLPVLGVPMPSQHLKGWDSLLSTVQMPRACMWPPSPSARGGGECGAVSRWRSRGDGQNPWRRSC